MPKPRPIPDIPYHLRDDPPLFEIVDDEYVDMPEISVYASAVAHRLAMKLFQFLKEQKDLGELHMRMLHNLRLPLDRHRRPVISSVSYRRWPKDRPYSYYAESLDAVPELAALR